MLTVGSQTSAVKAAFSTERARLLFGQFRKGDANDPATYVTTIAAVFSRYPNEVVNAVVDPRTGIALQTDWLPTAREVAVACEKILIDRNSATERERLIRRQLEERSQEEAAIAALPDENQRAEHVKRVMALPWIAAHRRERRQAQQEQIAKAEAFLARCNPSNDLSGAKNVGIS